MLELDGLTKRYGEVVALDGCGFSVRPGRIVGFLGPNGAGKTSAMRAIFGLLRLDEGTVTWMGRSVTHNARRRFGYMPEMRGLYPRMPVRRQVIYFGRLHGLGKAAAAAAADRWIARIGLEERADSRVDDLSHGNQQRVQLVTALVHDPELLVLDEPFSGLDPLGVEEMSRILRERAEQGSAVLFSSHQLDLVEHLCDDVAIINQGRVALSGPVRTLKDRATHRRVEVDLDSSLALTLTIPGFRLVESLGTRHILRVPAEVGMDEIMTALTDGRRIREFSYGPPILSDLFREAVAS